MSIFGRFFGASVPIIQAKEVHEKLKRGKRPLLLDVRQPEEFRSGHIAGSKLIPLGELDRRLNEIPKGREVVCVCASGHRSVPAARKLIAAGYSASSMKDGMIAWRNSGLPINKGMSS